MPISIICQNKDPKPWFDALKRVDSSLDVRIWPDDGDRTEITFVLSWRHPVGLLKEYPKLQTVSSMGAGVDHILRDVDLPPDVNLVRIVDEQLAEDMADYVAMAVSNYRHHSHLYAQQQNAAEWAPKTPLDKSNLTIGVMGLGQIGCVVAQKFANAGYRVYGWSRSNKTISGVACLATDAQLAKFLNQTNILINLLPLTTATHSILNRNNLQQLKSPAYVINVGRGQHLVERDLLELLDSEQIDGACLDVFSQEPLPSDHPFWAHSKIVVTPHVSSLTRVDSAAAQVVKNYRLSQQQKTLLNQVERLRGY